MRIANFEILILTFRNLLSNRTRLSSIQVSNRTVALSSEGATAHKSLQWLKYSVSSQLKHPLPFTQFCKLRISRGFATSLSSIRRVLSTKSSAQGQAKILSTSLATCVLGSVYRNPPEHRQFSILLRSVLHFYRRGYSQGIKRPVHLRQHPLIAAQVEKDCLVSITKVEYVG